MGAQDWKADAKARMDQLKVEMEKAKLEAEEQKMRDQLAQLRGQAAPTIASRDDASVGHADV